MSKIRFSSLAVASLAAVFSVSGCGKVVAKAGEAALARKDIELTVYKDDFAVVKENRPINLAAGRNRVGLLDVSKSLDQNSVIFDWNGGKADVVSSTYDLGVGASDHLLKRFLGKQVDLVRYGQDGKESDRAHGTLEVADPGNLVLNVDGKYLINPQGTIEAPGNTGIVTIPQLSAEVDSPSAQNTDLKMTYLTHGLSWSADYVATLASGSDMLKLETWASITNTTGTDFPNAKISFVAGSPNQLSEEPMLRQDATLAASVPVNTYSNQRILQKARTSVDAPVAMGELYAYPMKASASIAQDQSNRVRMIESDAVEVHKDYSIRIAGLGTSGYEDQGPDKRHSATVAIGFHNTEKNHLGVPLPAGAVRVYEPTENGSLTYIGAAQIEDTPAKASVFLTLSNVFDVFAQNKAVKQHKIDRHNLDESFEITVHNDKKTAVTVRVVQGMEGRWKIIDESDKSTKPDASTAQWKINLKPGEERVIKATARYSW
jgi:hypothetical protein